MRHENIIPLMGFWDNFEPLSLCLSFVSPWMDHRNLHEYMKEHPELKESERIRFVSAIYLVSLSFLKIREHYSQCT